MTTEPESTRKPAWWRRYRVILYFLLGLVLVDGVLAAHRKVWRAYDPDDYLLRARGCRRGIWDLVIVGGSPVSEGIDPSLLAGLYWQGERLERVYNLGLPGATTSEVWHAVEHGIAQPPRLLLYGISASDLNDGRDEPHGPRSLMDLEDLPRWFHYRPQAREWCLRNFFQGRLGQVWSLYRYRNGIRMWAADQIERLRPGTCAEAAAEARRGLWYGAAIQQGHGFAQRREFQVSRLDFLRAAGAIKPRFPYLDDYHVGGHLAYLHHLLDWAESRSVKVVLVDMPVSADLEERIHPQAFRIFRDTLAEVARNRGVAVLHASRQALGLSDSDFADLIHLNINGTIRLSQWLRSTLTNLKCPARSPQ
jgi:hypothetical protein